MVNPIIISIKEVQAVAIFIKTTYRGVASILLLFALLCISAASVAENKKLNPSLWSYATDPYGSEAIIRENLVTDEGLWVNFKRIPRVDAKRNSWVEVIYKPNTNLLAKAKGITIIYKCNTELLLKLSQKHYGKEGDKSYAHYQIKLPAAQKWQQESVSFSDFKRPDWTPISSVDHGIILEQVKALYFAPSMTDDNGGEATLQIRQVELVQ